MRVAAQGLTVVALVAGTWSMRPKDAESPSADSTATRNDVEVEKRRLERIAKERGEFEERLKGAERAENMEAELRARRGEQLGVATSGPHVQQSSSASVTNEGSGGNKWWRWLGGR